MWRCGAEQAYCAGIELLPVPVITERQDMREVVAECGDTLVRKVVVSERGWIPARRKR
jgi:hypothetical protein